jgi:DNA-binding transcriptional MerR regulator
MTDQIGTFNLKAVIQKTGLNGETLRAWERRYGLPKPGRTAGGHRLYTMRDIQTLNWLSDRQKEGMSISRAVEHWRGLESDGQDPLLAYTSQPEQAEPSGIMLAGLRQAWLDACLEFDERKAEQVLAQAFALYAPEVVCKELLQRGLSILGSSWYEGETTIQQEHFASALTLRRLHALAAAAPIPNRPGRILAACPEDEEHEIALLLLTVLLRRRGWDVVYLGANVPIIQLEHTLRGADPFLVVSVAQTLPSAASLRRMGEFLAVHGVHLAYGGGIFNAQPSIQSLIPGFYLGEELSEATKTVERIWMLKSPVQQVEPTQADHLQALRHLVEFQPHIEIFMSEATRGEGIHPAHSEVALAALQRHLAAALSLGDIHLLANSLEWLEGLLENRGVPRKQLDRFLEIYQRAIASRIPAEDQKVFAHLTEVFTNYSPASP